MCQKHLKHVIARDQRSPRSKSLGCYSFGLPLWMSGMQRTQSDHARLDLLSHETNAQHRVGAKAFWPSIAPACRHSSIFGYYWYSTTLRLSQEPREVRRTNKLMFFYRDFLILMLLLQIASMLLVKYFCRRNVPPKAFLDRQNGRKYS